MKLNRMSPALLDDITANKCILLIGAGLKNVNGNNGVRVLDWKDLGNQVSNYNANQELKIREIRAAAIRAKT